MVDVKIDYSDNPINDEFMKLSEQQVESKNERRNGAYRNYIKYKRYGRGNQFADHDYENLKYSIPRASTVKDTRSKVVKFNLDT